MDAGASKVSPESESESESEINLVLLLYEETKRKKAFLADI